MGCHLEFLSDSAVVVGWGSGLRERPLDQEPYNCDHYNGDGDRDAQDEPQVHCLDGGHFASNRIDVRTDNLHSFELAVGLKGVFELF